MTIQIIADGPSDLPLSYFEENNLISIPHGVHINGIDYLDKVSISPKEVNDFMRAGGSPKTSHGSPAMIEAAFRKIAEEKQQGIYLVFSSELSGTFATALMLRDLVKEDYPDFQMKVIDSKCASIGLGLVVKACVHKQHAYSYEELIAFAESMARHTEHLFTVDNLDYIARGGRMTRRAAFVGGMLNIKPLLTIVDGKIEPIDKFRGKKKLYEALFQKMAAMGDQLSKQTVGICHADCLDEALNVKAQIEERFDVKQFEITEIGASITAHAGPGALCITFLNKLQ